MGTRERNNEEKQRQKNFVQLALLNSRPDTDKETQETETGNAEDKPRQESLTPMLTRFYEIAFKGKSAAWTAIFTCILCVFTYLLMRLATPRIG